MRKTHTLYSAANALGVSGTVSALTTFELGNGGRASLFVVIDNGAGAAPTDAPVGVWELYVSADGTKFVKTAVADAELVSIKPNGNNVVEAVASFEGVPGRLARVRYVRTTGGGTDSRVTLHAVTET